MSYSSHNISTTALIVGESYCEDEMDVVLVSDYLDAVSALPSFFDTEYCNLRTVYTPFNVCLELSHL